MKVDNAKKRVAHPLQSRETVEHPKNTQQAQQSEDRDGTARREEWKKLKIRQRDNGKVKPVPAIAKIVLRIHTLSYELRRDLTREEHKEHLLDDE